MWICESKRVNTGACLCVCARARCVHVFYSLYVRVSVYLDVGARKRERVRAHISAKQIHTDMQYIILYIYTHTYSVMHTSMHAYPTWHTHKHTQTHLWNTYFKKSKKCMHKTYKHNIYTGTHTCHTFTRIYTHAHCTRIHHDTCTHAYVHTQGVHSTAYMHYIHTCIHAYIHTAIHT
jgi:hypothetical protein